MIKMILNQQVIDLDTNNVKNKRPIHFVENEEIRKFFDEKMKNTKKIKWHIFYAK